MKKNAKATIRKLFISKRDSLTPIEREEKSALIADRLQQLDEYKRANFCLLYSSFRSEVITDHLIPKILSKGKRLALPITDRETKGLRLCEIKRGLEELVPSTYGIREPKPITDRFLSPEEIDLFLVPGVAFDPSGTRLGFGGGYYDRLLANVPKKRIWALAFEIQITSDLPCEPNDVKMQKIITESRVIDCIRKDQEIQKLQIFH